MNMITEDWDKLDRKLMLIYNKIDEVSAIVASQNTIMAVIEESLKNVNKEQVRHETEQCNNITRHCNTDHKGFTITIITVALAISGGIFGLLMIMKELIEKYGK